MPDVRSGKVRLGPHVEEQVHEAADLLGRQGSVLLAQLLKESYRPRETYGSSFAKLFARIFSAQGLILLDPLEPALHRIAAPVYGRAIEDRDILNDKLLQRGKQLESAGLLSAGKSHGQKHAAFLYEQRAAKPGGVRWWR